MICDNLRDCCADDQYACENGDKCIIYKDFRPQAVCEEKGKRYNLLNDRHCKIALFHVDGGLIRDERNVPKCDFLYVVYDQNCPTAIFVELKGKDIKHAINQLRESIDRYGRVLERRICARIVCSSVPRLYNDPIVKNMKKELTSQYKGTLLIFEKNRKERYSDI